VAVQYIGRWSSSRVQSRLFHCHAATLGKSFTHIRLYSPSSINWYQPRAGNATAGLAESIGSLLLGLWLMSPVCLRSRRSALAPTVLRCIGAVRIHPLDLNVYVPYKKGTYPNFWQRLMSDIAY